MNTTERINIAYKIGCYVGTIAIVFLLFEQYFSNEDKSIVIMKSFEDTKRNSFPAITLCFKSADDVDGLYHNQYILSTTGLTGKQYRDSMMGNIKISHSSGFDKLDFEMATIKLHNYMTKFKVDDTIGNKIIEWKDKDSFARSNVTQNLPVGIYYQDPTLICYTYHTDVDPNITLLSASFYFSISKLQSINGGKLLMYVHHNNQLLRNMRFIYKLRDFKGINFNYSNNYLTLDLNDINIIRRRKDANSPCNEDLQDDDEHWMQHVVALIGCFPPYWKNIYLRVNNFNECNTTEQLKNMSRYLPWVNERMTRSVLNMYHPPCDQMRVLANSQSDRYKKKSRLKINFRFRWSHNIACLRLV